MKFFYIMNIFVVQNYRLCFLQQIVPSTGVLSGYKFGWVTLIGTVIVWYGKLSASIGCFLLS